MTPPRTLAPRLATALALLAALAACGGRATDAVVGSGHLLSEVRAVSAPFHGVRIVGAGEVLVTQGPEAAVSVEADDNVIGLITTEVREGVLEVGPGGLSLTRATVTVHVTTPSVDLLEIVGAGQIRTAGALDAATLTVRLLGAGDFTLSGAADHLQVLLAGAGDVRAFDLTAATCAVDLTGAGDVQVTATDALDATLAGVGQIVYAGNPASVQRSITGVGTITAR